MLTVVASVEGLFLGSEARVRHCASTLAGGATEICHPGSPCIRCHLGPVAAILR